MGACGSAPVLPGQQPVVQHFFVVNDRKPGQGQDAMDDFKRLKIEKRVLDEMYATFVAIDRDGTGVLDLDEFYRYFNLERSPFADRVFGIMDEDASGDITFREFVICLWNYCSMDVRSLIRFSFDLFDADLSGYLDVAEVFELLAEVYGEDYEHNYRLKKLIKELDENGDEKISFEEFRVINERYPSMLFPAFRMQKALRDHVLGDAFWQEQLKKRIKMGYGASPTIWEILDAVDAARKAIQEENMRKLEENQYRNPLDADEEGPATYVARPSLSEAAKRDPKIAQVELLERAERGWRERDEREKRRARNHAAFEAAVSVAEAAKRPERVHPAVEHGGLAEAAGALDTRSERLQNRIGRAVAMQDSTAAPGGAAPS